MNTEKWKSSPDAERYHRLQYLANYYRWSSQHGPEIGARCPITGRPYTLSAEEVHRRAHKKSAQALSREYFKECKKIREYLKNLYR